MKNPILGVTMGDPAGVGPEIIVRAGAEPEVQRTSRPVVIGAAATLGEALALVGSPLRLHSVTQVAECRWQPGTLEVLDLANVDMATLPRARVSAAAGRAAYEYIETAVALAKAGPLPADTLFSRARGGEFDIVVAMYHDQGHIPVKTLGFNYDETTKRWVGLSGVNVTVGLPFLRVSVDHGTAFDRAWKGIANHESMVEALHVAVRMLSAPGARRSSSS